MHWGVDSSGPADARHDAATLLREGESGALSLFELVRRRMGQAPAFWGRGLNRPRAAIAADDAALSPREFAFLRAQGCRVLPIFHADAPGGRGEGHREGHAAAGVALELCAQLDVPAHVIVYAARGRGDDDDDDAWLRGWFDGHRDRGRRCGLFGAPLRVVGSPGGGAADPFYLWSNQPAQRRAPGDAGAPIALPGAFAPAEPAYAGNTQTVLWQCLHGASVTGSGAGLVNFDLATAAARAGMA